MFHRLFDYDVRLLKHTLRRDVPTKIRTILALMLWLNLPQVLNAAVIEVDTTAFDLVQDKACSLREAVRNAKNDSQSSIDCAAGSGADIITFNSSLNGTTITLDNRLVIDSDIAFHGPGADLLTLSGGGVTRIFINNASGTTTLRDLTLSNGFADDGGALSSSGVLLVERCEFSMNQATAAGGAIHISSGMATIADSTFTGNTASTGAAAIDTAGNTSIINSDPVCKRVSCRDTVQQQPA